MNLIVNRPLGPAEKQLIYELTLKKRKSKKSTMSEKQLLAKQQLARELLPHQRMGPMDSLDSLNTSTTTATMMTMMMMAAAAAEDKQSLCNERDSSEAVRLAGMGSTSSISREGSTSAISSSSSGGDGSCCGRILPGGGANFIHQAKSRGSNIDCDGVVNLISSSLGSSGCSFSRSDSSYSGSSQDSSNGGGGGVGSSSGPQTMDADELSRRAELERLELLARKQKEANIRFKRSKLEHLNEELGRRLYQYEYLVAQEKALLGTCNMMLFTNEGVNNFHLMRNVPFRPD